MQQDKTLNWNFDNSYRRDLEGYYAPWRLDRPPAPELLLLNRDLADELGLPLNELGREQLAQIFAGGELPDGAEPIALAYAGHQFGQFSQQLGDGRALLLGEILNPDGKRFDIQLKGSGPTPFSRGGDGKSALGPALREYLVSEAMHALGVPTTRSLAVATTGEQVARKALHPGAVVTRVASSHLRVGTFQFFAANVGADYVRRLADYAIERHYPEARNAPNPYLALIEAVMDAQIRLVAAWINIGFVHGVMNTDNVTISGETIDYGPCAFLDHYSPQAVFSSIDHAGRYAFGNQPNICRWNITQLATALAETIVEVNEDGIERINALLADFPRRYLDAWIAGVRSKIGLRTERAEDFELANRLFAALEGQDVDFTNFFRRLADVPQAGHAAVSSLFKDPATIEPWLEEWAGRIAQDELPASERRDAMNRVNPLYIPRNHKVEEALAAAEAGDLAPFETLFALVTNPFEERDGMDDFAQPAPEEFGEYVTFCGT